MASKILYNKHSETEEEDKRPIFKLLRMFVHVEWAKPLTVIQNNLMAAALHIACMRDTVSLPDSYPDLPDKVEGFLLT